jgi:hypothetical protein
VRARRGVLERLCYHCYRFEGCGQCATDVASRQGRGVFAPRKRSAAPAHDQPLLPPRVPSPPCRAPSAHAVYGAVAGAAASTLLAWPAALAVVAGLTVTALCRALLPDVSRPRLLAAETATLSALARWPVWEVWTAFETPGGGWRVRSLVSASHAGLLGHAAGGKLVR